METIVFGVELFPENNKQKFTIEVCKTQHMMKIDCNPITNQKKLVCQYCGYYFDLRKY